MTQEELRDELLSIFEEHEEALIAHTAKIEQIEDEAYILFERKAIAIKNKLIQDIAIPEEELEEKYLEKIELARKEVMEDTEARIRELISK